MYPFVSAHVPRAYMATGENPSGETKVPVIITATFICCIIPTALTAMRIYVRHHLLHQLGKDDFLVIAALVVLWLNGGIGLWAMKHGFGRRDLDAVREGMDMRQLRFVGTLSWGVACLCVCVGCVKWDANMILLLYSHSCQSSVRYSTTPPAPLSKTPC